MTESWDQDLPPEALRRLSPTDKGRRSSASLLRKIEILEAWAKDGHADGQPASLPKDRSKLRRWQDAERRLWSWADPVVDALDGRNAHLMLRFGEAVQAVEARLRSKGSDPQAELAVARTVIANLERQNLRLLDEVRRLQTVVAASGVRRR